jgi:hypothetical protein
MLASNYIRPKNLASVLSLIVANTFVESVLFFYYRHDLKLTSSLILLSIGLGFLYSWFICSMLWKGKNWARLLSLIVFGHSAVSFLYTLLVKGKGQVVQIYGFDFLTSLIAFYYFTRNDVEIWFKGNR